MRSPRRSPAGLAGAALVVLATAAGPGAALPATAQPASSRCHTADLSGRFGFIQGAAGSRFGPVVLTNRSHRTCTLRGYIGAQLVGSGGRALRTVVLPDRSRASQTVALRPGRSAAATIRWSVIPQGSAACPLPHAIRISPPGETAQLRLRWKSGPVCGGQIDVRPLRAG